MENFQSHICKLTTKEIDDKVEKQLEEWINSQRPRKVPSSEVRQKALYLYSENGRTDIACSYGWYRRFKERLLKRSSEAVTSFHQGTDSVVLTWLLQVYDNNELISYKDLQSFAQNALSPVNPGFKASPGWAIRFLKRNHLLINFEGIYGGVLPPTLEAETKKFKKAVKSLLPLYPSNCIGCMDEIPLSFSSPINKIKVEEFEEEASKIYLLKKLSIRRCDATVILGLLGDATFLPPMIIIKVISLLLSLIKKVEHWCGLIFH